MIWKTNQEDGCFIMESKIITKENRAEVQRMEAFIKNHEKSHFLQIPTWADVKDAWDWRGVLAYEEGQIKGAMSVLIRPLPMGCSLLYAPRGPVCDRNDPYVLACLLGAADDLAVAVNALEFLTDPDEPDCNQNFRELMQTWGFREREDAGFDNVQAQHVFRLHLGGKTEDSVFANFCQKTRYNIRLAMRKGVQIRIYPGDGEIPEQELDAFNRIMEETACRDHFIPRQKEYYRKVFEALGQEAVLFVAYLADVPIAGTIGVYSGGKGWYLYGASSNAHRNVMPNYLLQWEMVRMALERHCAFYDFRGVPGDLKEDNPLYGLYRFKKGFGSTYTKFTGLFVKRYRPVLSWSFEMALAAFRKLRARNYCGKRKQPKKGKTDGGCITTMHGQNNHTGTVVTVENSAFFQ